jgi:glycosyltransferase involved in cell wall biosynthesis
MIWVERLSTAVALHLPREKTIVDLDDLEATKTSRRAAHEPRWYARWAMRREAARLHRVEKAAPSRYGAVCVCSEWDAAAWPGQSDRVWVVPNGTDDTLFDMPPKARLPPRIVFVGTMSYWVNEQAIEYFLDEVFPKLLEVVPDASLDIVGRGPSARVLQRHDGERVFVHPDVESVVPFVQRAVVSVVPLLVGGGTRLKILESLALSTPVVSTSIGAEGLGLENGREILLADRADHLVAALARVLTDQALARSLAIEGRHRVEAEYMWSAIRSRVAAQAAEFIDSERQRWRGRSSAVAWTHR